MARHYRVITPEMIPTDGDPYRDGPSLRTVSTVLWQGDEYPSEATLNSIIEGQVDVRKRQREANDHTVSVNIGNLLYIQKRRKAKLGWFVTASLELPIK